MRCIRDIDLMLNIEHLAARVGQLRDDGAARATHSVSRWRWRSGCRAGDATGCRAGSRTDKASDRSLVEGRRDLCTPINQVPAPTQSHREQETPSPCPDLLRKGLT